MFKILIIFALMASIGVATNAGGSTIPPAIDNINNSALINSAMNNKEIWKDVKDYEGLYQVSNLGNLRSLDRIVFNPRYMFQTLKGKLISPVKEHTGYYQVRLNKFGKRETVKLHRLVLITFVGNPDNKAEVNHKNGIKSDNRLSNLEWVTRSENQQHAFKNGLNRSFSLGKFGSDHHMSKAVMQYDKNDNFISEYGSALEAKRKTGISNSNIGTCCRGFIDFAGGYKWKFKT